MSDKYLKSLGRLFCGLSLTLCLSRILHSCVFLGRTTENDAFVFIAHIRRDIMAYNFVTSAINFGHLVM